MREELLSTLNKPTKNAKCEKRKASAETAAASSGSAPKVSLDEDEEKNAKKPRLAIGSSGDNSAQKSVSSSATPSATSPVALVAASNNPATSTLAGPTKQSSDEKREEPAEPAETLLASSLKAKLDMNKEKSARNSHLSVAAASARPPRSSFFQSVAAPYGAKRVYDHTSVDEILEEVFFPGTVVLYRGEEATIKGFDKLKKEFLVTQAGNEFSAPKNSLVYLPKIGQKILMRAQEKDDSYR